MKKILISAIALMMVLAMVMGVSAVAEESIVGNWTLDTDYMLEQLAAGFGMTMDEMTALLGDQLNDLLAQLAAMNYNFIFNEDGTFVMNVVANDQEMSIEGIYTVADGQITLVPAQAPDQPETFAYRMENGKLVLSLAGEEMVFSLDEANEAEAPAA